MKGIRAVAVDDAGETEKCEQGKGPATFQQVVGSFLYLAPMHEFQEKTAAFRNGAMFALIIVYRNDLQDISLARLKNNPFKAFKCA